MRVEFRTPANEGLEVRDLPMPPRIGEHVRFIPDVYNVADVRWELSDRGQFVVVTLTLAAFET